MTSIGGGEVAVRTFTPATAAEKVTASQLVADFGDEMNAKRAFEVLKSWRAQCDEELRGYDRRDVGGLTTVDVPTGVGGWYLLTYGPVEGTSEETYFDAQGITRVGSRISVLQMRLAAQDYDYPAGEEQMVAAVQRAATKAG